MAEDPYAKLWRPITDPAVVAEAFTSYPGTWCIGGGWALDLFTGEQSRPHEDIDVVVAREDLHLLHRALPQWSLVAAFGSLADWHEGEDLPGGAHDIWCKGAHGYFEFQLMVSEFTESEWIFRRDHRVCGPRAAMIVHTPTGLPIMAPEIQLLYKSSPGRRPKEEHDFAHTLPFLGADQRQRLASWLDLLYPDHPWLTAIESAS
jgi:hypothetical protein